MRLLIAMCMLVSGCATRPATPTETSELKDNAPFFDCLAKLGANQSQGYDVCAKLLG
jgi:hypothetical protein